MRAFLLIAGLSLGLSCLSALEPDELRPGMSEEAALSVYTGQRSCANVPLEEGPGFLAWAAPLYGRDARVELRLEAGRVVEIQIRFPLGNTEPGTELLEKIAAEREADLGPALRGPAGRRSWEGPKFRASLELLELPEGREIRLRYQSAAQQP